MWWLIELIVSHPLFPSSHSHSFTLSLFNPPSPPPPPLSLLFFFFSFLLLREASIGKILTRAQNHPISVSRWLLNRKPIHHLSLRAHHVRPQRRSSLCLLNMRERTLVACALGLWWRISSVSRANICFALSVWIIGSSRRLETKPAPRSVPLLFSSPHSRFLKAHSPSAVQMRATRRNISLCETKI